MRGFTKTVIIIGFLAFVLGVVGCSRGCVPDYSHGQRTGKLLQFSNKGLIWKRDKGEILLNEFGIAAGRNGQTSSQLFVFNTYDPEVRRVMEENIGKSMVVTYREWMIAPIWNDSSYEIVSVEIVED